MGKASETDSVVAERVLEAIKNSKYKEQATVARKLNYNPQTINNICRGRNNLTYELAEKLGKLLDVNPEYLLGLSDMQNGHWKDLYDNVNEWNVDYYKERIPVEYGIVYDKKKELFKLIEKNSKEIKFATKDQLDSYCEYYNNFSKELFGLFWEIIQKKGK